MIGRENFTAIDWRPFGEEMEMARWGGERGLD